MISVVLADDNPVIRGGLVSLLESSAQVEVVAEAANGKEAVQACADHAPDVALLDVRMPIMDGIAAAKRISPHTPVLMLTYSEDADIVTAAIRAGAGGYLVHGRFDHDELVHAIGEVLAGRSVLSTVVAPAVFNAVRSGNEPSLTGPEALTEREGEVMRMVTRGLSNVEIAEQLYVSEKTVKNHLNRAYAKLGAGNRAQAMAAFLGTAK